MMKVFLMIAVFLFACEGPPGPMGPPGADGKDGADGVDGEDGRDGVDGSDGEDGSDGRDGSDGKNGVDGADGADVTSVAVWVSCSVELDLIGDTRKETSLVYTTIFYANGDLEVECESRLGSAQDDFSHTYFPNVTVGASTGYCRASADYPPDDSSAGGWRFTLDENRPIATYVDDPIHPMDGDYFEFSNDDCHVYIAKNDGTWESAELEDVL